MGFGITTARKNYDTIVENIAQTITSPSKDFKSSVASSAIGVEDKVMIV